MGVPLGNICGCAPMMGVAGVVRSAECGPVSGCCGCVVGRVVEVESVGAGGCARRPVLDFRRTGGVIVAVCADPATSVTPSWQVAPRRGGFPGFSWVYANDGCCRGCPQCGARPGAELVGVRQSWVQAHLSAMRSPAGWVRPAHIAKHPPYHQCWCGGCLCVKLLGRR